MADIAAYRPLPEFNEVLAALEGRALQRPHAPAALVPMQLYVYHNSSPSVEVSLSFLVYRCGAFSAWSAKSLLLIGVFLSS